MSSSLPGVNLPYDVNCYSNLFDSFLCFLFIIGFDSTKIDCLAKFVNDSLQNFMKKYELDGQPRIYLKAYANIVDGQELRYDYDYTDLPWCIHVNSCKKSFY